MTQTKQTSMEILNTLKTRDEGTKQTAAAVCKLQTHSPPKTCYFTENKMFCFPFAFELASKAETQCTAANCLFLFQCGFTFEHVSTLLNTSLNNSLLAHSLPLPTPHPQAERAFPKCKTNSYLGRSLGQSISPLCRPLRILEKGARLIL